MKILSLVVLSTCSVRVVGEGFLTTSGRSVNSAIVDDVLLREGHSSAKLGAIQAALQATFRALPKNEYGQLDPSTVRYALHRYFVRVFGWYVKGLEPDGFVWADTSTEIVKDRVPAHIQTLLEKRMHGRGLDLANLAIFAATLTELIEQDVTSCFEECYTSLGFSKTSPISASEVDMVMKGYLATHLYGGDDQVTSLEQLQRIQRDISNMYAGWPNAQMWMKDMRRDHDWRSQQSRRNPFVQYERTFDSVMSATHDIMHQFVGVANIECPAMKNTLMELEFEGTGRIRLVDFYTSDQGQPRESEEYLRSIGCIDESVPGRPMLLIANYVSSRANCLVDTSYYSTCCLNECEGLMAHIENTVTSPDADPGRIADIVSHLPSDTIDTPRNLSATLLQRLNSIADHHGGSVPLHGRLFSQWMHHAYPRECPYPHLSGSTKQLSQEEWILLKGVNDVIATDEEMKQHQQSRALWKSDDVATSVDGLKWSTHEELVAVHWRSTSRMSDINNIIRLILFGVVLTTVVVHLTRKLNTGQSLSQGSKKVTHSV